MQTNGRLSSRAKIQLEKVQSNFRRHRLNQQIDRLKIALAIASSIAAVLFGWYLGIIQHEQSDDLDSYWISSANQQSPHAMPRLKSPPTHSISAHTSRATRTNFQVISEAPPEASNETLNETPNETQEIEKPQATPAASAPTHIPLPSISISSNDHPSPATPNQNEDTVVIAVNPQNPLDEISVADFQNIIMGKVNNWHQVGGYDLPVRIYRHKGQQMGLLMMFDSDTDEWTGHTVTPQKKDNIVTVDTRQEVTKYLKICKKGIAILRRSQVTPELKLLRVVTKPDLPGAKIEPDNSLAARPRSEYHPHTP